MVIELGDRPKCRNALIIICLVSIVTLVVSTTTVTFAWYQPCMEHLQTVTCKIVKCTFTPGYNPSISTYDINVIYRYAPFNIIKSYDTSTAAPHEYCQYTHPTNSTLKCYYDSRDRSTFSYDFDCHGGPYSGIMVVLFISLGTIIVMSCLIVMGCAPI